MKAADEAARTPARMGALPLSEEYRRAIEQVESLTQNRSGADKSWVERSLDEYRAHYSRAERVR